MKVIDSSTKNPSSYERHESFVHAYAIIKGLGFSSFEEAEYCWKREFPFIQQLYFAAYVDVLRFSKFDEGHHHPTWFCGIRIDGAYYMFHSGDTANCIADIIKEKMEKNDVISRLRKPSSSN